MVTVELLKDWNRGGILILSGSRVSVVPGFARDLENWGIAKPVTAKKKATRRVKNVDPPKDSGASSKAVDS